jgi:hypothetical protein
MEATYAVIELPRQAGQCPRWHSKQRIYFVYSQLDSNLETGAARIPKEVSPKPGVCQQATKCPLHVPLTHCASSSKDCTKRSSPFRRGLSVLSHMDV